MEQVLKVANSPVLWMLAALIVSIVVIQALLYLSMTLNFSNQYGILTPRERRIIYKTATINSIGPAVAIFFVAVTLITMVGGPVTLMRVGVIGSAIFEFVTADIGARAFGAKLGSDSYTLQAFTNSVWLMTLGGMGWLISTFFMTKSLDRTRDKLSVGNPELIRAAGTMTPIAIFLVLGINEFLEKSVWLKNVTVSYDDLAALTASAVCMLILHVAGKHRPWLREWAVGFAMVAGLAAGYSASHMLS